MVAFDYCYVNHAAVDEYGAPVFPDEQPFDDGSPPPYEPPPSYYETINGFVLPEADPGPVVSGRPAAENAPPRRALKRRVIKRAHDVAVFLIYMSTILVLWGLDDVVPEERINALHTIGLNTMSVVLIFISFFFPKKSTTTAKFIILQGFVIADLLMSVFLLFASFVMFKDFLTHSKHDIRFAVAAFGHITTFIIEMSVVLVLMFFFKCPRFSDRKNGDQRTINDPHPCLFI